MTFMRTIAKILYFFQTLLFIFLSGSILNAQAIAENPLKFNKTSHNFGKFSVKDGVKQCSFEYTNTSNEPIVIYNVVSSCGCTEPVWDKKPIMPGKGGKIEVTYLNDQGPYPFEKSITLYTSASKKPIILRISGVVYENERSVKDMFPIAIGPLGVVRNDIKLGQIYQGMVKSGSISVANLSKKDVEVKFEDVSKGLFIVSNPKVIKAGEIADISYTVNTTEQENWGNTVYSASVVCNGVKAAVQLKIHTMIVDNFMNWSKEQKNKGAMILAKNSSISIGKVALGTPIEAIFELRNTGAGELKIHKADSNGKDFEIQAPETVKPGETFTVKVLVDTNHYLGSEVFTITLVTNSPNRPLVNLFVAADIE